MFHFVCFCRSNDHNYLMLSDPGFFLAMDLATFIHRARSVRQANPCPHTALLVNSTYFCRSGCASWVSTFGKSIISIILS